VLAAFTPRRLGVQNRLILARVQMPPLPLGLMVVQFASRTTFRTFPIDHVMVGETNVDLTDLQFQFH